MQNCWQMCNVYDLAMIFDFLNLGELTLNDESFLNSMIGDSVTNDLKGPSLSLLDHESVHDTKFDQFDATDSSKKKTIRGSNFKPDEERLSGHGKIYISMRSLGRINRISHKSMGYDSSDVQPLSGRRS